MSLGSLFANIGSRQHGSYYLVVFFRAAADEVVWDFFAHMVPIIWWVSACESGSSANFFSFVYFPARILWVCGLCTATPEFENTLGDARCNDSREQRSRNRNQRLEPLLIFAHWLLAQFVRQQLLELSGGMERRVASALVVSLSWKCHVENCALHKNENHMICNKFILALQWHLMEVRAMHKKISHPTYTHLHVRRV